MKMHKKLTRTGGLTIPKEVRATLGLFPGQAVDLEVGLDEVTLKKHIHTCRFCGSPDEVLTVMGIDVCESCSRGLVDSIKEAHDGERKY